MDVVVIFAEGDKLELVEGVIEGLVVGIFDLHVTQASGKAGFVHMPAQDWG